MPRPHAGRAPWARALSTLGLSLAALAAAGQALAGPLSGLPWPSGAKDGLACLTQLRGRAIDVQHFHVLGPDFPSLVTAARGWVSRSIAAGPPMTLASFALLPTGTKGQFAACAAGQFDQYWTAIGAALKAAAGTTKTVFVEPGWEANLGSGPHPWGVDDISQIPAYRSCFQHAATALRSTFPGAVIMWSNAKRYFKNYTVDQMNPGDQYFDHYGLLYYDNYTPLQSQATWDKYVNGYLATGPSGIGSWLAYAQSHGKKLGISEWGLWDRPEWDTATADDPVFVDNMFQFFKANATSILYETYQNNGVAGTDDHRLCPTTAFPNAQAAYARDWQGG